SCIMRQAVPPSAPWVVWMDRRSLLAIAIVLLLGVGVRLASIGGIIWMAIFFTATAIWPVHNPFVDEHVVDAVVLAALFLANAGRYYGLGKVWQRTKLVGRYPVLA